jgi:hypothetical protein
MIGITLQWGGHESKQSPVCENNDCSICVTNGRVVKGDLDLGSANTSRVKQHR